MFGNRDKDQSVTVKAGTVDMWWRRDTPELTVLSELDGTVKANIVTQDYGASLWVHLMLERGDGPNDNWKKRMHWAAFVETLGRTVKGVVYELAGEDNIHPVANPQNFLGTTGGVSGGVCLTAHLTAVLVHIRGYSLDGSNCPQAFAPFSLATKLCTSAIPNKHQ